MLRLLKIGRLITGILFLCLCVARLSAQPNINQVEYFIDTDPGLGKAIAIAVNPVNNINKMATAIDISSLAIGLHNLYIRSRDDNGRWSITNQTVFVKTMPPAALVNKAEYFFDTDPGLGNGINIPVTPGMNLPTVSVSADIETLSAGLHNLYIRTRNNQGRWSITNQTVFIKLHPQNQQITLAEYYIDNDPGMGKATPIAFNPGNPLDDFAIPVNITGLADGEHQFCFRSMDEEGKWSITNSTKFQINTSSSAPQIHVNAITRKQICASEDFKLSFDATGIYNSGNQFTVQLSDGTGNFSNPLLIGSVTGINDTIISCKLPRRIADGNNYKVRVVSSNPLVIGSIADTTFTLYDRPDLGNDTTTHVICNGETVNLATLYNTTGLTAHWNTDNTTMATPGNYTLTAFNSDGCSDTALVMITQEFATWTGQVNANWHNAANWSNGKIPGAFTHVVIPTGTGNHCVISDADVAFASLHIKPGATIRVLNGRKATITGNCQPIPTQ